MDEKRTARRVIFRRPIQFEVVGGSLPAVEAGLGEVQGKCFGGCLGYDLSLGGIRLYANDFVALDTPLTVSFSLFNNDVINAEGRVVWVQRIPHSEYYQVGLQFTHVEQFPELKGNFERPAHSRRFSFSSSKES